MNISGNTIFIPGATSGIGLGLARRFADAGNKVIIAGRRQHLVEQINGPPGSWVAVKVVFLSGRGRRGAGMIARWNGAAPRWS